MPTAVSTSAIPTANTDARASQSSRFIVIKYRSFKLTADNGYQNDP